FTWIHIQRAASPCGESFCDSEGDLSHVIRFRPFVLLFSSISESFFMVKGAALFLQQGSNTQGPKTPTHHKHAGDLPQHLQVMFKILRSEDRIKLVSFLFFYKHKHHYIYVQL
uniref:Uncharacterized protein n=1 Tax=Xiphophorus couchianus TaxID=32473 RepID=A0A3B5L046_9TELE